MDAEKFVQALTPQEAQEVADALPADVLRDAVARRSLEVPTLVGPLALEAGTSGPDASETTLTQAEISQFLDPKVEMPVESQLEFMTKFWGMAGLSVPALNEAQKAKLAETVAANPGKRVIPAPLAHVGRRRSLVRQAKAALPDNRFSDDNEPLLTSTDQGLYGKLLAEPERTVEEDGAAYGLGYKTPLGEVVVGREAFQAALLESGEAAQAEDLGVWVFPVLDVAVESDRAYTTAGNLYHHVGPTDVPEALITMQLLHQANGTPNGEWHVDFTNEAVYELDETGEPKALVRVAGVHWDPGSYQINLISWPAGNHDDKFGVRGAAA